MKIDFEKAAKKGFSRWTKGDKDRLYFNIADNGALDIDRYKSGSISSAYLDGEKISHARANRILATRAYLDLKTGETVVASGDEHDLVTDIFEKALKEVEEVEEVEKPKAAKKLNNKFEKADDKAEVSVNGTHMKKVTFGSWDFDNDTGFNYFDAFVDNEYIGFVEKSDDSFVFWELSDNGENFVGGHVGRYVDGVDYDSLDELEDDLETQE